MSKPRRHHYVPAFLLANFTDTGAGDGFLHVHDLERGATRRQRPDQVAHERDFYRVDDDAETDSAAFEKALARLEAAASPVVAGIVRTWDFPDPAGMGALLVFVAFQAARVPLMRRRMIAMAERVAKETLEEFAESPESYATALAKARAKNSDFPDIGIEVAKQLAKSVRIEPIRTGLVGQIPLKAKKLAKELFRRPWTILCAEKAAPDFILSDAPVVILPYARPNAASLQDKLPDGCVTLPLGPRVALMSNPRHVRAGVVRAIHRNVALVNGFTVREATFLYSRSPDFIWLADDGRFRHASDALAARGRST